MPPNSGAPKSSVGRRGRREAPAPRQGFIHPRRPGYHETDQSGIIHHSVYLRWFEDARVAFLRERGLQFGDLEKNERIGMVVHHADIRYKVPAKFDEDLAVETWIGQLGVVRLRFDYRLWRGEELLSEAEVHIACIHLDKMRPIRIPAAISDVCY